MKKNYVIKESFKGEKDLRINIIELFLKEWSVNFNDTRKL